MADARADIEKLHATLTEMGERAAADPTYRESLRTDQVGHLAAAGVSMFTLSGALTEAGADEEEVSAYGMSMLGAGSDGPQELMLSNKCIGTCTSRTIWLCGGGCGGSIFTSGPRSPQP